MPDGVKRGGPSNGACEPEDELLVLQDSTC